MWKSLLIFTAVLFNRSDSFQGPINTAAVVGSDVTMSCASNDSVTWTFFELDSRMSRLIYANFTLESQHGRFTVKGNTVDGRSNLTINGVVPEDAGTYWCFTVRQQDKAQLIVFASDPICNIEGGNVSTNDSIHVDENDFVEAWCTIRTWGNWLPKMDWSVVGGPVLEVGVNETTKGHSGLTINASTFSTEAAQLACEIYFTAENNPDKTEVWNNIPSYVYSWRSPVIFIKRSRTNEGQTTQPVEWKPTANSILDENEPSLFSHTHDSHRTVSVEPSARGMIVIPDNNPNTLLLIIISVLSTLLVVVIIGTSIFCCCYNQRKKLGNSREGNVKDGSGPDPSSTESRSMDYHNSGKQFKSSRPLSAYFNPYSMIDENEMTSSLERRARNPYANVTRNYAEILVSSKETLNSDYDDVSPSTTDPPGNKYNNKEAMTNKYYTPLGGLARHKRALADYTKFIENNSTLNEGKSNYCLENRTTTTDEMLVGSGLDGTQETDKEITQSKYTPLGKLAIGSKLGNPGSNLEPLPNTRPGLSSSIENLLSILESKDGTPSKQVDAKDEAPSKQMVSTDGAPTKQKDSTDGAPSKEMDSTDVTPSKFETER